MVRQPVQEVVRRLQGRDPRPLPGRAAPADGIDQLPPGRGRAARTPAHVDGIPGLQLRPQQPDPGGALRGAHPTEAHPLPDRLRHHVAPVHPRPAGVYFLASVYRHLAGNEPTLQKKIGSTGNAAGMTAMVALSFFLVPVSRHSVLLSLAGWAEEKAVRLHIWAGRIAIVGATFHGLAHMLRWWTMGVSVVRMLLPGGACWRWNNGDVTPSFCADGSAEGECTCYELFRNFTGLVAVLALLVIGFSSLPSVRRNSYTIFYTLHVTAGPLTLIVTMLHWNRMLLFLCPSIIYYLASTVPILIQLLRSYLNEGGVKLLSATELATMGGNGGYQSLSCICLNFEVSEEAAKQFRSGQYVKVIVPEISMISHPFTVSRRLDAKQKKSDANYLSRYRKIHWCACPLPHAFGGDEPGFS